MDELSNPPVQEKSKGMGKTFALIVVLIIVVGGLLFLAFSQKPGQSVSIKPAPTATEDPVQTILTISSVPIPLATASAYRADVIINTGQDKINSVQLELSYDPKVLSGVDITPGGFFVDPKVSIKNIDKVNGHITFAFGASGPQGVDNGVLGQGIAAVIYFSVPKNLKTVNTTIKFEPKTQVLGDGFSNSLLKTTIDGTFVIEKKSPTPTASPSASTNF